MGRKNEAWQKHSRQQKILEMVSQPGGASSQQMVETFRIARATIIQDIKDLRRQGHPIQTSSMKTEHGIYVAVFELLRTPKRSSGNTHAASAR